ncbi:MAG: chromate resistance protein [Thermoanaerobaculia bacterium]|nr:chromate resistance protein [Thermoanaerobaculia bacterium]
MADARWLLLVHSLPPKPLYLRAKVRLRLAKVGALALKNSVYVLPRTDDTLEDFQWIAQEARAGGGQAFACDATFVEGLDDGEIVARLQRERSRGYRAFVEDLRSLLSKSGRNGRSPELAAGLGRAVKRLDELKSIDFFEAPGRKEAEAMLRRAEGRPRVHGASTAPRRAGRRRDLSGRVWVTRRGVKIDRIASAWLVRRFIDPAARFRFVDPAEDAARPGELRFDMVGGDFTHEGDRCTFETLRLRAGVGDAALSAIAEIVHDIDLKDGKYGRPDAAGVKQLIEGLIARHATDEERLERGFALFDDLHASFRTGPSPKPRLTRKRK